MLSTTRFIFRKVKGGKFKGWGSKVVGILINKTAPLGQGRFNLSADRQSMNPMPIGAEEESEKFGDPWNLDCTRWYSRSKGETMENDSYDNRPRKNRMITVISVDNDNDIRDHEDSIVPFVFPFLSFLSSIRNDRVETTILSLFFLRWNFYRGWRDNVRRTTRNKFNLSGG